MLGFTETVLRDANQSLVATRMKREDFENILHEIDSAGYYSVECWGGATFDSCIRYLDEDPWERLRFMRQKMPNSKLQMLLRGQNLLGYTHYPTEIVRDFVKASIENGIDIIRIFDALNDINNIKDAVAATLEFGGHPSCAISYTVSPVHDVDSFVKLAKEMEAIGAMSICIKDMSGCLMPDVAYELVTKLKASVSVPIILHSHCSSGVAQMTYLKAIEAGVDVIDTAVSSFSGGTSQPPTETLAMVARNSGVDVNLDIDCVSRINSHFQNVFDKMMKDNMIDYHSLQTDPGSLINQVPGGMYSNMLSQLKAQGISDKLEEVLNEIPQVRKDLGYPPLVTPISQMVGTQAVANVLSDTRYQVMINEVKAYLRGEYGKAPGIINPEVQRLVDNDTSGVQKSEKGESFLLEKEKRMAEGYSLEDAMTWVLFPQIAEKFFEKRNNSYSFKCEEHSAIGGTIEGKLLDMNSAENDDLQVILKAIIAHYGSFDVDSVVIKKIIQQN